MHLEERNHCFMHFLASKTLSGTFWGTAFNGKRVTGLGEALQELKAALERRNRAQKAQTSTYIQLDALQVMESARAYSYSLTKQVQKTGPFRLFNVPSPSK